MKNHYLDYNVFYSITTNGTILNNNIIQLLRENNIVLLISIDGPDNARLFFYVLIIFYIS
jgi:sulfatase maturation enzyme AslB (radical SAM superfamily)